VGGALIVWSSQLILHWMERWPVIILIGAGLLGYVAGQMLLTDPGLKPWLGEVSIWTQRGVALGFALVVVVVGRWLEQRMLAKQNIKVV